MIRSLVSDPPRETIVAFAKIGRRKNPHGVFNFRSIIKPQEGEDFRRKSQTCDRLSDAEGWLMSSLGVFPAFLKN
jgi:hypothetical protein